MEEDDIVRLHVNKPGEHELEYRHKLINPPPPYSARQTRAKMATGLPGEGLCYFRAQLFEAQPPPPRTPKPPEQA